MSNNKNAGGQQQSYNSNEGRPSVESDASDANRPSFESENKPYDSSDSDELVNVNIYSGVKSVLELPRKLRCEIWKRVGYKYLGDLRRTSRKVKNDVDHHVGISASIDERESLFDSFFSNVGIRKATITNLASPRITEFLLHPELLVELSIHGIISTPYFKYLMKSCENIHRLSIVFNKKLLKMRPLLFPQIFPNCLPKCKALRFVSHTKREKDLIYICDNIVGLVKDTLEDSREMVDILFSLIHGSPSPYLEELVLEVIVFAHKNSATLHEFHLNVKERETPKSQAAGEEDDGGKRRDTGAITPSKTANDLAKSPSSSNVSDSGMDIVDFSKDRKNSSIMEDAERYVRRMKWRSLPQLKKLFLSVNPRAFGHLNDVIQRATKLSSLQLELTGGASRNCWNDYRAALAADCSKNLTAIKLVGVFYRDENENALALDFAVFKKCRSLKKLSLSCYQNEGHELNQAKGIASLPKSLEEFELSWVTLSAWQWFRLLYCFKRMDKIAIAYATTSDSNFGWLIKITKGLVSSRMTKVQVITVTDFKIKFRNKRSVIKKLEKAVPIKIVYHDMEETLLLIDRGQAKQSTVSIPSIASE